MVKRFKYRLESVLTYRRHMEDLVKGELAQLMKQEQDVKRNIDENETALKELEAYYGAVASLEPNPQTLESLLRYYEFLKKRGIKLSEDLKEASRRVEEKRAELVERMKERKVLETLKEKQKLRHGAEAEKADQAVLDELGSMLKVSGGTA